MFPEKLVGEKIQILVGDPWEFIKEHGAGPFQGTITHVNDVNTWLVRFAKALTHQGARYTHAWLAVRYEGDSFRRVFDGVAITANGAAIPSGSVSFTESRAQEGVFPRFVGEVSMANEMR